MSTYRDDTEAPWERELREALGRLPQERAPRSLRRRLRRIPLREGGRGWRFRPAWALSALLPLVAVIGLQQYRLAEQQAELAQAREDLALALSYVEKANVIAAARINATLADGFAAPVLEQTRHSLYVPVAATLESTLENTL